MLKKTGWSLTKSTLTSGDAMDTLSGTWLNIMNTESNTGYVLRLSNLGVVTYEMTDKKLGLGVNQHGSVRPMQGSADFKFITKKSIVSELELFDRHYYLQLSDDLSCLRLNENGLFVLALDWQGLWRYKSYASSGYANGDSNGRIQIIRTGFNAAD